MASKEMRKTKIGMRSRRRSPLRNEFEVSPQIFGPECSTRWLSAQHFRSIIQPNYQQRGFTEIVDHDIKCGQEGVGIDHRAAPYLAEDRAFYSSKAPSVQPSVVNSHQAFKS